MILHPPKAVVCDMDGLLVDSERLERRVWQAASSDLGVAMSDARFATFVGHPADEGERMLRGYYGADFDVVAFRERCHSRMRALVDAEGVPLRPGAREWLEFVRARRIPIAVATSSSPPLADERLPALRELLDTVVTRADVTLGKPHPDLYLEAARRLGVDPRACLALEDSPTGARAAIAAAMPVILVPDLVQPPQEMIPLTAGVYESLDAVQRAAVLAWD